MTCKVLCEQPTKPCFQQTWSVTRIYLVPILHIGTASWTKWSSVAQLCRLRHQYSSYLHTYAALCNHSASKKLLPCPLAHDVQQLCPLAALIDHAIQAVAYRASHSSIACANADKHTLQWAATTAKPPHNTFMRLCLQRFWVFSPSFH